MRVGHANDPGQVLVRRDDSKSKDEGPRLNTKGFDVARDQTKSSFQEPKSKKRSEAQSNAPVPLSRCRFQL